MKRLFVVAAALAFFVAGCGSPSTSPSTTAPAKPTFTAALSPDNDHPPIVGVDAADSGTATITFGKEFACLIAQL